MKRRILPLVACLMIIIILLFLVVELLSFHEFSLFSTNTIRDFYQGLEADIVDNVLQSEMRQFRLLSKDYASKVSYLELLEGDEHLMLTNYLVKEFYHADIHNIDKIVLADATFDNETMVGDENFGMYMIANGFVKRLKESRKNIRDYVTYQGNLYIVCGARIKGVNDKRTIGHHIFARKIDDEVLGKIEGNLVVRNQTSAKEGEIEVFEYLVKNNDGKHLSTLYVSYDASEVQAFHKSIMSRFFIYRITKAVVEIIVSMLVLFCLVRGFRRLSERIENMANSDFINPLDESNLKEISAFIRPINFMNKRIVSAFREVHRQHGETLKMLVSTVEAKDVYTKGHSERVMEISRIIAEDCPAVDQTLIVEASLLHDIGKIGICETILNKNGPLTKEEFVSIKSHPEKGAKILASYRGLSLTKDIILQHHERYDGNGYPKGLKGDEIILEARIIAIADAFDAMTSDRPYRQRMSYIEATKRIIMASGSQFDPCIVRTFRTNIGDVIEVLEEIDRRRE